MLLTPVRAIDFTPLVSSFYYKQLAVVVKSFCENNEYSSKKVFNLYNKLKDFPAHPFFSGLLQG